MSLVFGALTNQLTSDTFKDNEFDGVTKQEFESFLKEFTFDKLKGKRLGKQFAEKFNIKDRVLYMFSHDGDALKHIEYCNYIK